MCIPNSSDSFQLDDAQCCWKIKKIGLRKTVNCVLKSKHDSFCSNIKHVSIIQYKKLKLFIMVYWFIETDCKLCLMI